MKIRNGFVSNSSSTAFIIVNKTEETLTLVDFIQENPQFIENHIENYRVNLLTYTQENLIKSAKNKSINLIPGDTRVVFGEDTLVEDVLSFQLRDGGESESFCWSCKGYCEHVW